jgi:hypothetical protein
MASFETFWRDIYGEIPPVRYRLRLEYLDSRWVRFHSLPESKRYPDSVTEMGIVLERENALADRVLGVGSECWMIANSFPNLAEELAEQFPEHSLVRDIFKLQKSYSWRDPYEKPEDQTLWTTYAGEFLWQHGEFDEAFKIISEDIETNVLWVSKEMKSIFSPYDGGIDLVVRNSEEIVFLKNEFEDWLSHHSRGF